MALVSVFEKADQSATKFATDRGRLCQYFGECAGKGAEALAPHDPQVGFDGMNNG